jgi:hypothetical protein
MIPHIQYKARRLFLWRIYCNRTSLSVRNGIWYKTVVDDAGETKFLTAAETMITICSWTRCTQRSLPCNIARCDWRTFSKRTKS